MTTDNYTLAEDKGRAKLQKDYDKSPYKIHYIFTQGKYDKIDSFATAYTPTGPKTYANEVKNRDIYVEDYWDLGFILEKTKYDALMEAYTNSGYCANYVNYFKDARIVWDVSTIEDVESRWITMECTRTTATNYGNRVPKQVILLYPEEGRIRRYDVS